MLGVVLFVVTRSWNKEDAVKESMVGVPPAAEFTAWLKAAHIKTMPAK